MGMVEKVARAIARDVPLIDGGQWSPTYTPKWPADYSERELRIIIALARTAITAMQEPTPKMHRAGRRCEITSGEYQDIWDAMIKSALKEDNDGPKD